MLQLLMLSSLKWFWFTLLVPFNLILGDWLSHNVKTSVLVTFATLLAKASAMFKPFISQMQITFLRLCMTQTEL